MFLPGNRRTLWKQRDPCSTMDSQAAINALQSEMETWTVGMEACGRDGW